MSLSCPKCNKPLVHESPDGLKEIPDDGCLKTRWIAMVRCFDRICDIPGSDQSPCPLYANHIHVTIDQAEGDYTLIKPEKPPH